MIPEMRLADMRVRCIPGSVMRVAARGATSAVMPAIGEVDQLHEWQQRDHCRRQQGGKGEDY